MALRISLLLLICALRAKASEINNLEIQGCKLIKSEYGQSSYNCVNSTKPSFNIKYKGDEYSIMCYNEYRLKNFPSQNLRTSIDLNSFKIEECELTAMAEFSKQTNNLVPNRENFNLGSFYIPKYIMTVEFKNTGLFRLPEDLFSDKPFLMKVRMAGNRHSITLPRRFFSNLLALKEVTLINFGLSQISNDTFNGSTEIRKIDLSRNRLAQLPEGLFDGLINLKVLQIGFNELHTIPDYLFRDLKNLKVLTLHNNKLSNITNNQFDGLKSLRYIVLNDNMIDVVEPRSMEPFANSLERADLKSNKISFSEYQLNNQLSPFSNFTKLVYLYLDGNNISVIFKDWTSMKKLETLSLSYNSISKLTDLDFTFASSELNVDLNFNKISSIELNVDRLSSRTWEVPKSQSVNILIGNNPIVCDCNLYYFKQFQEKKVFWSPLEGVIIDTPWICDGPNDMKGQKVADVKSENLVCENLNTTAKPVCPYPCSCEFSPDKNADLVDCSNRNLTESPYQLFPSRTNVSILLNLSGNRLTKLPTKDQLNYHLVKELNASHNLIDTFKKDNILPNLKVLALDHNKLTILEKSAIYALQQHYELSLTLNNNIWICDCATTELFYFLKEFSNSNVSDIICSTNNTISESRFG